MVIRKTRLLLALLGAVTLVGCGTQEGNAAGGEGEGGVVKRSTPQLVVFMYDRSTSISHHQLGACETTFERAHQEAGSWRPHCGARAPPTFSRGAAAPVVRDRSAAAIHRAGHDAGFRNSGPFPEGCPGLPGRCSRTPPNRGDIDGTDILSTLARRRVPIFRLRADVRPQSTSSRTCCSRTGASIWRASGRCLSSGWIDSQRASRNASRSIRPVRVRDRSPGGHRGRVSA